MENETLLQGWKELGIQMKCLRFQWFEGKQEWA